MEAGAVNLPSIRAGVSALSPYPITRCIFETPDRIMVTLSRPMVDGIAHFTFALSQRQLESAHDPEAIIAAHVKTAAAELAARENSRAALAWA